jgi:hypothetical protein
MLTVSIFCPPIAKALAALRRQVEVRHAKNARH